MKRTSALFLFFSAISLSGCGALAEIVLKPDPDRSQVAATGITTIAGAGQTIDANTLYQIDLTKLVIDSMPEQCRRKFSSGADDTAKLYQAFADFRSCSITSSQKLLVRNGIQDFTLATSERACSVYTRMLSLADSNTSMAFGSLATILGGMSAIFTPASTARALGGASGISSGLNAQFRSSFFQQQTVTLITSGIKIAQTRIRTEISDQQKTDIQNYSLEHALQDTIRYNDACSVAIALDTVKDQMRKAEEPGVDAALNIQRKLLISGLEAKLAETKDDAEALSLRTKINDLENATAKKEASVTINLSETSVSDALVGVSTAVNGAARTLAERLALAKAGSNASLDTSGPKASLDKLSERLDNSLKSCQPGVVKWEARLNDARMNLRLATDSTRTNIQSNLNLIEDGSASLSRSLTGFGDDLVNQINAVTRELSLSVVTPSTIAASATKIDQINVPKLADVINCDPPGASSEAAKSTQ